MDRTTLAKSAYWETTHTNRCLRPSKKKDVSRPDFYLKKKRGGPVGGRFFLLFIISYCMLSLHIITFPRGYVGALRSNINKTKHQIFIRHKFV